MNPNDLRESVRDKEKSLEPLVPPGFRPLTKEEKASLKEEMGESLKDRKQRFHKLANYRRKRRRY